MANSRYGLDLGNILARASSIKSAQLNIKQKEKELDKQAAGEKLRRNVFAEDGLSPEEVQEYSVLAPEVAKDIKATQQKTAQVETMTNYYMKKGQSKEEANLRATGYADDIDNFDKEYRTKTKFEQEQIRTNISQQGQMIQSMMEVAQKNPQQANQMYQDFLANKNEQIKQLLRDGQTEIADKLQESIDKAPPSLIKEDGSFNAEFPMMTLSKYSTMMTNAETYDVQAKSYIKITEAEEKEKIRQKRPTSDLSSKEERLIKKKLDLEDKIDNETITQRERKELDLINKSMSKSQIREGVSERGMTKTNDMMSNFSKSVGSTDFFNFSDKVIGGDMAISDLSTAQKKDLGKIARREQSVTKNRIDKDDKSTLSSLKQTTNVIDVMKGSDFTENYGPIDKYKDDVLRYFRGDENAAKSAMISAFLKASTVNANIKGVPSNADLKLISQGLSDKTMNEDQAAKMMIAGLEKDLAEAKDTLDRAIVSAPATAIFKYGDVVSDLKESISIIKQAFKQGEKETKKDEITRLRKTKPKQNRQSMYQQIAAQRPNATPEQINAYLDSKGY